MNGGRQHPLLCALAAVLAGIGSQPAGRAADMVRWPGAGFQSAEHRILDSREIYPRGRFAASFRLDLTVAFARRTPWTQARAVRQIRQTAAILRPCGIALGAVRLARIELDSSERRIDASHADLRTGVPPLVAAFSSKLPPEAARPAVFLVGRVDGTKSLAVSYRAPAAGGPSAPHFDTAWISYRAHWLPRADERYSPVAHELAHLLCRCGHAPAPTRHLLHPARNFLSSHVLPEHCASFRESPLLSVTR